jgi:flagellar hook-length control protein FliK
VSQVAHAVAAVHVAAGAQGQVTIHLQPGELGAVQVKIERAVDGTATVTVQVEKADTLHVLQQDVSHLHQALDRAGVPQEQRQVTLQLAAPSGADGFGTGTPAGGGSGRGGQPQQHMAGSQQPAPAAEPAVEDDTAAPRWIAAGINITA